MIVLSPRSEKQLIGVHPDLVSVVRGCAASTPFEFVVTEGVRSLERQQYLINAGLSRLKDPRRGRHTTGHAVDLCVIINGVARWDQPAYRTLAALMKNVALSLKVPITWGGDWKTFYDGPHFELPWEQYPVDLSTPPNAVT